MAQTITVVKKRDKDVTVSLKAEDGSAFNLTGLLVKMAVRDRPGGDVIQTWSSDPAPEDGEIEIIAPATNGQVKVKFRSAHFETYPIAYGDTSVELSFDVLVVLVDGTLVPWRDGSDYIQKLVLEQYITEP